ncbi:MAG: class I SAM-dependent methyltransferase [Deltaproteobacteria bacterium]|nr:class I SAM-dependent methyltransferase [Deltaproteobacteria bacterium]
MERSQENHTLNPKESTVRAEKPKDAVEGIGHEETIYNFRFSEDEDATRRVTWRVLCSEFLQQFVSPKDTVVDIGAGDGNFLLNIQAGRKIAVDLSAQVQSLRDRGIEIVQAPATELSSYIHDKVDVVFMSNFLEHLPERRLVLEVLEASKSILKKGGRVMILQPNIRYVGPAYWDYIDHHIALTEHSLQEALEVTGFKVERMIPRFRPYTAKSKVGHVVGRRGDWLVRMYLRMPLLWKIFGQQTFVVARI